MAKKIASKKDFTALYSDFKKRVDANDVLAMDPLLKQLMTDFERMAKMNDSLWESIEQNGYTTIEERTGKLVINPAVGTYNKNASQLLKSAQVIDEKTRAITIVDDSKSW